MNTYKSIYGYLNAALHFSNPKKVRTESPFYFGLLDCFDIHPEETFYKAHWDAYFNETP